MHQLSATWKGLRGHGFLICLTFAKLPNSSLQCWILFMRNKLFWIPSVANTYARWNVSGIYDIYVGCKNILPVKKSSWGSLMLFFFSTDPRHICAISPPREKKMKKWINKIKTQILKSYISKWNDYFGAVCLVKCCPLDAGAFAQVTRCVFRGEHSAASVVSWWPTRLLIIYLKYSCYITQYLSLYQQNYKAPSN